MHACDIIAWTFDGAAYCDSCGNDEMNPVFGEKESDAIGMTCDACAACYVDGAGWIPADDIDGTVVRWAKCPTCNHHHPYWKSGSEYRDARLAALEGRLRCDNCGREMHF